jgi:geranylgeranyl pyrophosphate synthase
MIITVKKNFTIYLRKLPNKTEFLLSDVPECATKCSTGNEAAISELTGKFAQNGRTVNGFAVLDTACDIRIAKKDLGKNKSFLDSTVIVALTCGAGIQAIEKITDLKNNTVSTVICRTTERIGVYNQYAAPADNV